MGEPHHKPCDSIEDQHVVPMHGKEILNEENIAIMMLELLQPTSPI